MSVAVNQVSGQHQWNWTSVEPLECTSLSIRIRSRDGQATSEWSNTEILQGQTGSNYTHKYCFDWLVNLGLTYCLVQWQWRPFLIQILFLSRISLLSQTNDFPLCLNIDLYLYLFLPSFLHLKILNTALFILPHSFSGNDLPSNEKFQMYPQDRVAPVGANTTFCCIVEEGKFFGTITYGTIAMNTTRLSRRSYATTAVNQGPTNSTGTNVFCQNNLKTGVTGTVVFVGCKKNG